MRMWPFSSGGPWWWLADHSCYLQELGCAGRQSPGRPAAQSPLSQSTSWDIPVPCLSFPEV